MCKRIRISCVIVDDIDFTPMGWVGLWDSATIIDMRPMDQVGDLVEAVRVKHRTLQQYDFHSFRVLRILRPVPREKGGLFLLLNPILQRLRERTREANKTELANEYVKVLSHVFEIQDYFKHEEAKLISAIVVRLTAPGESSLAVPHIPFDTI